MKKKSKQFIVRGILFLLVISVSAIGYRNYKILKQVHTFDELVTTETKAHGISEYRDLALSIIYTESKGLGNDPMQSSESLTNTAGTITASEQSIKQGVLFLAKAIKKAKEADVDIWTAVQAYNFGLDYISYVKENGGKTTVELAETYSRDVLSPKLGNEEQTKYRYYAWRSFIYNGGYLYHNGGNMFYADLVQWNLYKIQWTTIFF